MLMSLKSISSITRGKGSKAIQQPTNAIRLGFTVTLIAKSDLVKAAHAPFDSRLEFYFH